MILPKSNAFLRQEAARLRREYFTEGENDVATIARDEYGINVARTFVNFGRSVAFGYGGDNFIAYDGLDPKFRKYVVAHELGHHVAGHPRSILNRLGLIRPIIEPFMEIQADLFARELTGLNFSDDSLSIVKDEREEAQDAIRMVKSISDYIGVDREKLARANPLFEQAFPWDEFERYLTAAQKVARRKAA